MRIGVIGPNRSEYLVELTNHPISKIKEKLDLISKILANSWYELVISPEKDSLTEHIAKKYLELNGGKIFSVIPLEENYSDNLNVYLGETINCIKNKYLPSIFIDECDIILCIGYGATALAIIGSTQYSKKPIIILKDLISVELPIEINKSLDIKYIKIHELKKYLKEIF